jgi:Na+/H+-dicarboxylate symporter
MSEARAITNLIGNAVATMVIAKWNGVLDLERAKRILDGEDVRQLETVRLKPDTTPEAVQP